jgi:hypothetical protein
MGTARHGCNSRFGAAQRNGLSHTAFYAILLVCEALGVPPEKFFRKARVAMKNFDGSGKCESAKSPRQSVT